MFALANGHIGLRGNLDEGEPYGIPGTYLGGFYETRPLPYAEAGFGYPEDGQTVVNVTNGKLIRLLVEDEPFDVRYGTLRAHERVLDLRDGVLRREVEWESPTGRAVRVSSTRLVSFTHRAVAAIEYMVEPVEGEFPVVVQSSCSANEEGPAASSDPRAAAALASPLVSDLYQCADTARHPRPPHQVRAGCGWRRRWTISWRAPRAPRPPPRRSPTSPGSVISADLAPGKPLRIVKLFAYGWSAERSVPALRDQVSAAGQGAVHTRLGGPAQGPARLPRRLLGSLRRRARGRRRAAAGDPLRALPHACRPAPAASSARSPPRA